MAVEDTKGPWLLGGVKLHIQHFHWDKEPRTARCWGANITIQRQLDWESVPGHADENLDETT